VIVKVPVYFFLDKEDDSKIENIELLKDHISKKLDEHLSGSSFNLEGSWWNNNRLIAKFFTQEEALAILRHPGIKL
jgi:hypothetical protein